MLVTRSRYHQAHGSLRCFVEIADGIEGLVHISQISNVRIAKPDEVLSVGQEVEMKVMEVNPVKVSLSIRRSSPSIRFVKAKKNLSRLKRSSHSAYRRVDQYHW